MVTLIQREFTVGIPLQRAWNHVARVEQWPSWAPHIKRIELHPLGELGPESTGVIHLTNGIKSGETYAVGRRLAYALMVTFGTRMAAVFMFVTSTIGLRTAVRPRWVSFVGFASGLVLLLIIDELAWVMLLFPCWVHLVSTWILIADLHKERQPSRLEGGQ
jgi:hypothetical protein